MRLTAEQQDAVEFTENLVITACPGSGKTTILTHKISRVLTDCRAYQGVVSLSYTNKSSDELKARCINLSKDIKASFFGTTDKFLLSEVVIPFIKHIWTCPSTGLEVIKASNLDAENREILTPYYMPENMQKNNTEHGMAALERLYERGIIILEMVPLMALYIISESIACQRYLKVRYKEIFIDEYQDTGFFAHQVFRLLAGLKIKLTVVGDVDQSIYLYAQRSADSLKDFIRHPDFTHKQITLNHRCHPSIINYANRLKDPDCILLDSDSLVVYHKSVTGDQANIAAWIDAQVAGLKKHFSIENNKDIAVLVRSNLCAELIADNLRTASRTYLDDNLSKAGDKISGLVKALLRYRYNKKATAQLVLDDYLSAVAKRSDVVLGRKLIRQVRVTSDANLPEAIRQAVFSCTGCELSETHIIGINDALTVPRIKNNYLHVRDDEVQIMTLHKSKGLEFDVVIHLDLYDWVLPAREYVKGSYDVIFQNEQQCLNLHYVGITRARKGVILMHSTKRYNAKRELKTGNPSQFLTRPGLKGLYKEL